MIGRRGLRGVTAAPLRAQVAVPSDDSMHEHGGSLAMSRARVSLAGQHGLHGWRRDPTPVTDEARDGDS